MKKLIILSLSLSVSCAQASQKPDQNFFPESHAGFSLYSNWLKDDPQVKIEESPARMKEVVDHLWLSEPPSCSSFKEYSSASYWFIKKHNEAVQCYQADLIYKYTRLCFQKYNKRSDTEQYSASAIRAIAVKMKQNGFDTYSCDTALDKFNK